MFKPKRILFEKDVMQYPMAQRIYELFEKEADIEIVMLTSNRVKQHIPGDDLYTQFREGKRTLVVDTKKILKFQSCKPSAHYQLPLVSGCMGQCEYCYLNTNLGDKPFVRVNANVEEILEKALRYTQERLPDTTLFEGAATSDPLPVEPYTHSLRDAIVFFGQQENARFRFVSKYNDVDTLLNLEHCGHTEARFSINTDRVIKTYERGTASYAMRIEAGKKMAQAGYPVGFLIAPIFIYPEWKEEYTALLTNLREQLPDDPVAPYTFEIISHRYTTIAKNRILEVFPETTLPMQDEDRKYKYGQFGYGKYVYPKEQIQEMKTFFTEQITKILPQAVIKYVI